MIKQKKNFLSEENEEVLLPTPDYLIKENDNLLFFGSDESIKTCKEWE